MLPASFFLGILNALGVFALITLIYGATLERVRTRARRNVAIGLLFGTGAGVAILNAVELTPGLRIDPRAVMLVLAAPFGGPVAAAIATAIASAVRLWVGGAGAIAGVANIASTALIGLVFANWFGLRMPETRDRKLLVLGLFSSAPLLFILTVQTPDATTLFLQTIGLLAVIHIAGVWILGHLLSTERSNFQRTQALQVEATTDPLTGLPNRRSFESRLVSVLKEAAENDQALSLLVIDIDRFKKINDRFGHDIGDEVLVAVGGLVCGSLREGDLVARFGGEEIVVLLTRTDRNAALEIAERIRLAVSAQDFGFGPDRVTVSVGAASQCGSQLGYRALFKSADAALYAAKHAGRNRVEHAAALSSEAVRESLRLREGAQVMGKAS